jgi:hypothetical protein
MLALLSRWMVRFLTPFVTIQIYAVCMQDKIAQIDGSLKTGIALCTFIKHHRLQR